MNMMKAFLSYHFLLLTWYYSESDSQTIVLPLFVFWYGSKMSLNQAFKDARYCMTVMAFQTSNMAEVIY